MDRSNILRRIINGILPKYLPESYYPNDTDKKNPPPKEKENN